MSDQLLLKIVMRYSAQRGDVEVFAPFPERDRVVYVMPNIHCFTVTGRRGKREEREHVKDKMLLRNLFLGVPLKL